MTYYFARRKREAEFYLKKGEQPLMQGVSSIGIKVLPPRYKSLSSLLDRQRILVWVIDGDSSSPVPDQPSSAMLFGLRQSVQNVAKYE